MGQILGAKKSTKKPTRSISYPDNFENLKKSLIYPWSLILSLPV
jgi:hypothetical protein